MHTVIIANEKMTRLFRDYKRLFDPFLKEKTVSFCSWNEEGPDLDTALPDLRASIEDGQNWRALIVHDPGSWQNEDGEEIFDEYNPYDYAVNKGGSELKDNPVAMVRLTHLLAGFPDLGVRETVEKKVEYRNENEKHRNTLAYRTEEYTAEERQIHKELQDKYGKLTHAPAELWLLCLRRKRTLMNRKDLKAIWRSPLETESSMFWQRNNYPEICRFLCFDISDRQDEFFTRELFELWTAVLTLALNKIPYSVLQAYRLYQVSCPIDKETLRDMFADSYSRLEQAQDSLSAAMKAAPQLSFDKDEAILKLQVVPLVYDRSDEGSIQVDTKEIGLSRDCPEDEAVKWREEFRGAKESLTQYVKEPRRAIDRAAEYTHTESEGFFDDEYELDRIQAEEIREKAWDLEENVFAAQTRKLVDIKAYEEDLDAADAAVSDVIRGRMTRKVTVLSGLIALVVYFCGFIPYLISAANDGRSALIPSLKLVLIVMACFALTAFLLLFIFRARVRDAMEEFNCLLRKILVGINQSAETFADYLSQICTYRKALSIIQGTKKKRESVISYRGLLRMHRAAISDFKDQISMWSAAYDITVVTRPIDASEEYYDFEMMPAESELYYFEKNETDIMINGSGETVTAPYRYVERLNLERQEIYDWGDET